MTVLSNGSKLLNSIFGRSWLGGDTDERFWFALFSGMRGCTRLGVLLCLRDSACSASEAVMEGFKVSIESDNIW